MCVRPAFQSHEYDPGTDFRHGQRVGRRERSAASSSSLQAGEGRPSALLQVPEQDGATLAGETRDFPVGRVGRAKISGSFPSFTVAHRWPGRDIPAEDLAGEDADGDRRAVRRDRQRLDRSRPGTSSRRSSVDPARTSRSTRGSRPCRPHVATIEARRRPEVGHRPRPRRGLIVRSATGGIIDQAGRPGGWLSRLDVPQATQAVILDGDRRLPPRASSSSHNPVACAASGWCPVGQRPRPAADRRIGRAVGREDRGQPEPRPDLAYEETAQRVPSRRQPAGHQHGTAQGCDGGQQQDGHDGRPDEPRHKEPLQCTAGEGRHVPRDRAGLRTAEDRRRSPTARSSSPMTRAPPP